MFKKLKDKIAEEVKQSPLKSVQQLAQAVVSPTSSSVFEPSSGNDKFCIEEGDNEEEETQTQVKPGGFMSVALTGQTSSPLRDKKYGFRTSAEGDGLFPVFESQPTNYHVQSDWESASEVEDRYSQLEHINKESLYEAYRKVYNRYNKMKNKYHELVTHYRHLERENEKAKTVLSDTQDKALLRISELREQCLLEQQAKAHLEEALRNELEERDHIINTLKTKVQYLKGVNDSTVTPNFDGKHLSKEDAENLIDFTDIHVTKVPSMSVASSNKDSIHGFEEQFKKFKEFLNNKTVKIESWKSKLEEMRMLNSDEEDRTLQVVVGEKCESNEEHSVYQLIASLINELSEEVKSLQENAESYSHSKLSESRSSENLNEKSSFDGTISKTSYNSEGSESKAVLSFKEQGSGDLHNKYTNSALSGCDIHNEELKKCYTSIKELKVQNELLNQRLKEDDTIIDQLKRDLNSLNDIFDLIKAQIKLTNENFETGNFNIDNQNIFQQIENDLIQELNRCVQNLFISKSELKKLENELKSVRDQMCALQTDQINKQNQIISTEENISKKSTAVNDQLKEELESLKSENNDKLSELEALSLEINDLKRANRELESYIKNLEVSLTVSQKECNKIEDELQQVHIDYSERKKAMLNQISSLKMDFEVTKNQNLSLIDSEKKFTDEISSLKKQNDDMTTDKNVLQNLIDELVNNFEQSKKENITILETNEKLMGELSTLQKEHDNLTTEKSVLDKKIYTLEKDLEENKNEYRLTFEAKEKLAGEINSLRKEYDDMFEEKNMAQNKFKHLEMDFENSKKDSVINSESIRHLSDELLSIKKDREEVTRENDTPNKRMVDLKKELENNKAEYLLLLEIKEKMFEELILLKKERDDLIVENGSLQNKTQKLDEELKICKKELLSSVDIKDVLCEEITNLKKENDIKANETNVLKEKINYLKQNLEKNITDYTTLLQAKNELSDEMNSLRKDYDKTKCILNDTKQCLENQQKTCSDVNEKLSTLSESFKNKCSDIEGKTQENTQLKTDIENLLEKIKVSNSIIENITKEKNALLHSLLPKLTILKNIQRVQKNLLEFFFQFRSEIINELNEIKHKVGDDLMCQVNSIVEDNNTFGKQIIELESKNKKDIDSYNSKIKHMQTELQNASKISKNLVPSLENSASGNVEAFQCKELSFDLQEQFSKSDQNCGTKLNLQEENFSHLNTSIVYYQNRCYELELNLKQAGSIMKLLKNFLKCKSEIGECIDSVHSTNEKCIQLDEIDSKNIQKLVGAIESFMVKCDTNNVNADLTRHALQTNFEHDNPPFNVNSSENEIIISEEPQSWEVCSGNLEINADPLIFDYEKGDNTFLETKKSPLLIEVNESSDEIQKLHQEIKLKDDIINKLQHVIEKYEHENIFTLPENCQLKNNSPKKATTSTLVQCEASIDKSVNDIGKDSEIYFLLKLENDTLHKKLQKTQDDHDLNMKHLIDCYKKQIEEKEEEIKLNEIEKLEKEKKFVVSEMKEQIDNLQEDLDERGDAFEKLYEEHQHSMKHRDEEIQQLRNNYEKEMREQDKKWRACLDRRLAEEETRHRREVGDFTRKWNIEKKDLEMTSRLAVSAVESGSNSGDMLRRQVQALTLQLNELQNSRCDVCNHQKTVGRERRRSISSSRSIQDYTEMEYLRNIFYEYMMGKEPLVLAKVLCALMKFDENQTNDIVLKEKQKITVFGQLL